MSDLSLGLCTFLSEMAWSTILKQGLSIFNYLIISFRYLPQLLLAGPSVVFDFSVKLISNIINVYISFLLAVVLPMLIIMIQADIANGRISISKFLRIISTNMTKKNAHLVLRVALTVICVAIYFNPETASIIFG